jgi:transcriptional regulator with XRE-family HTH domain
MSGVRVKPRRQRLPQHALLLLAIRRKHSWTQERLASEVGCARSTIARWERGEKDPHPMFLPGLRALLERPADELRNGVS